MHGRYLPILVVVVAWVLGLGLHSSVAGDPSFAWHTFYGASKYDEAMDIAVDDEGNAYVTGYSTKPWDGPTGQLPLHAHSGAGATTVGDLFVLKLSANGAYQWHTFYGGGGTTGTKANSIALDGQGHLYVAGNCSGSWTGPDGQTARHPASGQRDVFVLKLDIFGGYLWHTYWGSALGDDAFGLTLNPTGSKLCIAGKSAATWNGTGDTPPRVPYPEGADSCSMILALDSQGGYQWHAFYGSFNEGEAHDLAWDAGGVNLFVTGWSRAYFNGPGDEKPLNYVQPNFAGSAKTIYVLKIADDGTYRWHTFFGSADWWFEGTGNAIGLDLTGNIYVGGSSCQGNWGCQNDQDCWWADGHHPPPPPLPHTGELGGGDVLFVLKLNPEGGYVWHTFYGSESWAYGLAVARNGDLYIAGESWEILDRRQVHAAHRPETCGGALRYHAAQARRKRRLPMAWFLRK
ncbi:MAG: SBBP repeat-containing protein [Syntrophobacteraceae bacterium]